MKRGVCRLGAVLMAGFMAAAAGACGQEKFLEGNLAEEQENRIRSVLLFAPMEKSDPDNENVSRTAFDLTVGPHRSFNAVFLKYPAALQKFFRRIGQFQMILVKHILVDKQAVHHNFLRNRY